MTSRPSLAGDHRSWKTSALLPCFLSNDFSFCLPARVPHLAPTINEEIETIVEQTIPIGKLLYWKDTQASRLVESLMNPFY